MQRQLQQHLPLAVLKPNNPTVYPIGTLVATALTACGIETRWYQLRQLTSYKVATALTACGIETFSFRHSFAENNELQQHLPLAVLKQRCYIFCNDTILEGCNSTYRLRYWNLIICSRSIYKIFSCNSTYRLRYWNVETLESKRCRELAVATALTACGIETSSWHNVTKIIGIVATALTACGIETTALIDLMVIKFSSCNSTYRLWYATKGASRGAKRWWGPPISSPWPKGNRKGWSECTYCLRYWNINCIVSACLAFIVATTPTACGIETCFLWVIHSYK